uniref:Uncharacterized protein n=1 Tax=Nelumbo nucifera TaxID=4432 RepID=A0A822Z1E2_NELNU|nr:TPA_asm: hypothetical protein HUJ06_007457 [Nelumbo nucifera]
MKNSSSYLHVRCPVHGLRRPTDPICCSSLLRAYQKWSERESQQLNCLNSFGPSPYPQRERGENSNAGRGTKLIQAQTSLDLSIPLEELKLSAVDHSQMIPIQTNLSLSPPGSELVASLQCRDLSPLSLELTLSMGSDNKVMPYWKNLSLAPPLPDVASWNPSLKQTNFSLALKEPLKLELKPSTWHYGEVMSSQAAGVEPEGEEVAFLYNTGPYFGQLEGRQLEKATAADIRNTSPEVVVIDDDDSEKSNNEFKKGKKKVSH